MRVGRGPRELFEENKVAPRVLRLAGDVTTSRQEVSPISRCKFLNGIINISGQLRDPSTERSSRPILSTNLVIPSFSVTFLFSLFPSFFCFLSIHVRSLRPRSPRFVVRISIPIRWALSCRILSNIKTLKRYLQLMLGNVRFLEIIL